MHNHSKYMSEYKAKKIICEIGKRMYDRSFVAANDGNISIRTGEDSIICTPTGVSKGFMTPDMLVKINLNGEIISGSLKPSSEHYATIMMYNTNIIGKTNELSCNQVEKLIEIRNNMGIKSGGTPACSVSACSVSDRGIPDCDEDERIEEKKEYLGFTSVKLDDENSEIIILDQTLLPNETKYLHLKTQESIWDAIYKLQVRGAPAIGITGAFGTYLGVKQSTADNYEAFYDEFIKVKSYLGSSRPTAVNLFWALDRMGKCLVNNKDLSVKEIKCALLHEANKIREEDEQVCKQIGENALTLLKPDMGILTHCNAGTIATAKYGTALAPIYLGQERGYNFRVFADETRPLLQGARLTSWELNEAGIDVTLICDNMASIVMKNGWIDVVVVGCDRVAANGDTANKIGTSGVAILAKEYGIPFYVHAPLSTIDLATKTGKDIHIELRPVEEIYKTWYIKPMAPEGIKAYNPAFDVTDAKYITAIITEKGIVYPPYEENISKLFDNKI